MDKVVDDHQGIVIEVFLERPLIGNILTQFVPTLLLIGIRSFTSTYMIIFYAYIYTLPIFSAKPLSFSTRNSSTW